jgi:hypothetical protein
MPLEVDGDVLLAVSMWITAARGEADVHDASVFCSPVAAATTTSRDGGGADDARSGERQPLAGSPPARGGEVCQIPAARVANDDVIMSAAAASAWDTSTRVGAPRGLRVAPPAAEAANGENAAGVATPR